MCEPKYFDVSYDINPWMTQQCGKVDHDKAREQWHQLFDSLSKYALIKLINGIESHPDLVFTANAGFIHQKTAILSKFSKSERSGEEKYFYEWFLRNGYNVVQPDNFYEGEGDHLVDHHNRHWIGSGFRTDKKVIQELRNYINNDIFVLELVDPRWYHLDTAFCPLSNGEILWYPSAFSKDSQKIIEKCFDKHIIVDENDALNFTCNCVNIHENLFIPINRSTTSKLEKQGYRVYEYDLSEFMKAGGAAKCLTMFCS